METRENWSAALRMICEAIKRLGPLDYGDSAFNSDPNGGEPIECTEDHLAGLRQTEKAVELR
jgi:hypothetical protein